MNCPKCRSKKHIKDGIVKGRQRHKCKECKYRYTVEDKREEKNYIKRISLELYLEGLGFRSIGRILRVSHVTVYNWIKQFGKQVDELRSKEPPKIVEMDELYSYIGSKKTHAGYGLLLIGLKESSSILLSDAEELKQEKNYGNQ